MSLLAAAAIAALAVAAVSKTTSKAESSSTYDYAAAIKPLRVSAVEKLKSAVNVDPVSSDPELVTAETQAAINVLNTSNDETEIRKIRNRVAMISTDRKTAGMPTSAKLYSDAAISIEDLAKAIESWKMNTSKDLKTSTMGGRGGRPHTSIVRGRQLHTTR